MAVCITSEVSVIEQLLGRTLLVVAHPDDECIAYGTLLQRMSEANVVYVTDGAPQDPFFWHKYGSRTAYARLRQEEARRALAHVGVRQVEFLADTPGSKFEDQGLFRVLPDAYMALAGLVENVRPRALATLAFEGGHPDHDSCNLLTATLGKEFGIPVWEAPLYHREPGNPKGSVVQDFVTRDGREELVQGTERELARKLAMCGEYPSQGDFLRTFRLDKEIVRPLHAYDYSRPPHEGPLNYEVWQWSMKGVEVSWAFAEFLAQQQIRKQPAT